jgi:cytoskeletal protein RodZ
MARKLSVRGRPKGTGVDDKVRLEAVAKLLRANPAMRPTTAIKAIGVDDPSAIRRLRDKYTARQQEAAVTPVRQQAVALGAIKDPKRTAKPAAKPRTRAKKAAPPPSAQPSSATAETPSLAVPTDLMLSMYTAAAQSASVALEFQLSSIMFAFEQSAFARAYLNQITLGSSATLMLLERPYFPWTRH